MTRNAKPANLHVLEGTKPKVNRPEPVPDDLGVFALPDWLAKAPDEQDYRKAWQAKWDEVTSYLRNTKIGYKIDSPLVSQYVTAVLKTEEAGEVLTRVGLLVRNPDGSYAQNPMAAMFIKFSTHAQTLARELALSPTGRANRRSMEPKQPATVAPQARAKDRKTSAIGFA